MAKTDNLHDYLSDLANAIREKKGTSETINAQDFAAEIASIETSGGGEKESKEWKDVNFFDYDGTIVYSYTSEEALALTALPEAPDHSDEDLTFIGWTISLEDLKDTPEIYGGVCQADIGALYVPKDGKTRLYVTIEEDYEVPMCLGFKKTKSSQSVTVDWGDGAVETHTIPADESENSMASIYHAYPKEGKYIIKLDTSATLGGSTSVTNSDSTTTVTRYSVAGSSVYSRTAVKRIRRVDMGLSGSASSLALYSLNHLENVNCGNWLPYTYSFYGCHKLKHISLKQQYLGSYTYYTCRNLRSLAVNVLSSTQTVLPAYTFANCDKLKRFIPNTVIASASRTGVLDNCCSIEDTCPFAASTSLAPSIGSGTSMLKVMRVYFGANYTTWPYASSATAGTHAYIKKAVFFSGGNLASAGYITSNLLRYAVNLKIVDCRGMACVPKLGNNPFPDNLVAGFTIIVPDALYDSFAAATYWSSYASYMVKASEYNGEE